MGAALLLLAAALLVASGPPPPANPVYAGDFPDPFVVRADGSYYAYGTNGGGDNVQFLKSSDFSRWERLADPLPRLPAWAIAGRTWAPSVLQRGDRWILFFTASHAASGRQCIGRAFAAQLAGPFSDESPAPLLCQADAEWSIDASPFVDADGAAYLLWSGCCTPPVRLWAQKLSADGAALEGEPRLLLAADQPWEEALIEAPSMLLHEGRYYLAYSGSRWQSGRYAIGLAECEGPLGPCRKQAAAPLLQSFDAVAGPGGQEFFRDRRGRPWIAYHAWTAPLASYAAGGVRSLRVERVEIRDGLLDLAGRKASVDRTDQDSGGALRADPGRTPR